MDKNNILLLGKLILEYNFIKNKSNSPPEIKYLEAGAYNGIDHSNSLILQRKLLARGILIEPINEYFNLLKKNRPKDLCVKSILSSTKNNSKKFYIIKNGPLSSVSQKNIVNSYKLTLKKILCRIFKKTELVSCSTVNKLVKNNNIKKLDLIILDLEGMEYEVLDGINFNKLDIKAVLIECRSHNIMQIIDKMCKEEFILVKNFSNFNKSNNPNWDGTHQDYLFIKKNFLKFILNKNNKKSRLNESIVFNTK